MLVDPSSQDRYQKTHDAERSFLLQQCELSHCFHPLYSSLLCKKEEVVADFPFCLHVEKVVVDFSFFLHIEDASLPFPRLLPVIPRFLRIDDASLPLPRFLPVMPFSLTRCLIALPLQGSLYFEQLFCPLYVSGYEAGSVMWDTFCVRLFCFDVGILLP